MAVLATNQGCFPLNTSNCSTIDGLNNCTLICQAKCDQGLTFDLQNRKRYIYVRKGNFVIVLGWLWMDLLRTAYI